MKYLPKGSCWESGRDAGLPCLARCHPLSEIEPDAPEGLGSQAMARVADEIRLTSPALAEEFQIISREQRAGKLRLDAWRSMAERVKVVVAAKPLGTLVVWVCSTGASIPERGSGPCSRLAAVASAQVVARVPLVPMVETDCVPSGKVLVWTWSSLESRSTRYLLV